MPFSGNPKITLALVWTIILLWQDTFKSSETTNSSAFGASFSTSSLETPFISKMERTLLDWCKQSVIVSDSEISESVQNPFAARINVQNFTSSFSDGQAFLYILKKYHPELVDDSLVIRMKQEVDRKRLMEYTFQQYEKLGVPRLLDPEDFDNMNDSNIKSGGVDKKSVMTYVMCIFRKMHIPGTNDASDDHTTNISTQEDHSIDESLESEAAISPGEPNILAQISERISYFKNVTSLNYQ